MAALEWLEYRYVTRAFSTEFYAAFARPAAAIAKEAASLEAMRVSYGNPLFRVPMTFLEIFPVGLLVALVSAALLRNPKVMPAR